MDAGQNVEAETGGSAREQQWAQKSAEVDRIVDGLGRHVDPGIKDTITAANLLGINTVGSCEGHSDEDRTASAPYVDVTAGDQETKGLFASRLQILQTLPQPKPGEQPTEAERAAYKRLDQVDDELSRL